MCQNRLLCVALVALATIPANAVEFKAVAVSADKKTIAAGGEGGCVSVWDAEVGNKIHSFASKAPVHGLAFGQDSKTLIVGTDGAGLEIWTLTGSGWRTSKTIGRRDALYGMTVSADGKVLAVSMSTGWIYFYNTRSWEQTGVLFEPCNFFSGLVFAPDGKSIATAGATFSIWSLAADSTLWKPRGERSFEDITASSRAALRWAHSRPGDNFDDPYGTDIAFSPDGKRLAGTTGVGRLYSGGKRLRAWDTAIGKQVWESRATGMLCTGFTADGKSVLTGSDDGGLCVWTAASGKLVKEWRGHQKAVRQIAPLKDATFVSVGDDGTASVWDTAGNKLMSLKAD